MPMTGLTDNYLSGRSREAWDTQDRAQSTTQGRPNPAAPAIWRREVRVLEDISCARIERSADVLLKRFEALTGSGAGESLKSLKKDIRRSLYSGTTYVFQNADLPPPNSGSRWVRPSLSCGLGTILRIPCFPRTAGQVVVCQSCHWHLLRRRDRHHNAT